MICPEEANLIAYATGQLEGSLSPTSPPTFASAGPAANAVHEEMKNESLLIRLRDRPGRTGGGRRTRQTPGGHRTSSGSRTPGGGPVLKAVDSFEELEQCLADRYKILERVGAGGGRRGLPRLRHAAAPPRSGQSALRHHRRGAAPAAKS